MGLARAGPVVFAELVDHLEFCVTVCAGWRFEGRGRDMRHGGQNQLAAGDGEHPVRGISRKLFQSVPAVSPFQRACIAFSSSSRKRDRESPSQRSRGCAKTGQRVGEWSPSVHGPTHTKLGWVVPHRTGTNRGMT